MEILIKEYFKFKNAIGNDIKIIDELNPNKILKENIIKFIDKKLYKYNIDEELYNKKFNINYDLYENIIKNNKFGEYINSNFLGKIVNEFIYEYMTNNKLPIVANFNPVIYNLYKTRLLYDEANNEIIFKSGINKDYGLFLYDIIIKNKFTKTLEIGFAYGSSGLFICSALKNLELFGYKTYHKAIDPNQTTQWKKIGALNIKKLGYNNIEIIEKPDYIALPELLKDRIKNVKWQESKYDGSYEKFDMIFIDGWHTFDYTLLDFFYADLLLNIGGYIILDDAKFSALKELDKYLNSNYKFYKKENYEMSLFLVYKKIRDDDRSWDFHINFINR
jgi:hypothetical protein